MVVTGVWCPGDLKELSFKHPESSCSKQALVSSCDVFLGFATSFPDFPVMIHLIGGSPDLGSMIMVVQL